MVVFSIPKHPKERQARFLEEVPSLLQGMVSGEEWREVIRQINAIIERHTKRTLLSAMASLFMFPAYLFLTDRDKMDHEVEEHLRRHNIVFEKRGFFIHHPKETHYQNIYVSLLYFPNK